MPRQRTLNLKLSATGEAEGRIEARLPLPPSLNRLWRQARGNVYKSAEAKEWERSAFLLLPPAFPSAKSGWELYADCYLAEWRRDLDNCSKILVDTLARRYGLDDRYLTTLHLVRYVTKESPYVTTKALGAGFA